MPNVEHNINSTYRNIFILGGLLNTIGTLILTRLFTNEVIVDYHPTVMSQFGLFMLMPWGILMFIMAKNYSKLPQFTLVLAFEKIIYVIIWIEWIRRNTLSEVFEKDFLAGLFYAFFGINDFLFFIAFIFIYGKTRNRTIANTV